MQFAQDIASILGGEDQARRYVVQRHYDRAMARHRSWSPSFAKLAAERRYAMSLPHDR